MATIEVFSGPGCGYCEAAKTLLDGRGLAYVDNNISDEAHKTELLRRLSRVRTIPQIFIDGERIGGFEDLEILNGDGRLDRLTGVA